MNINLNNNNKSAIRHRFLYSLVHCVFTFLRTLSLGTGYSQERTATQKNSLASKSPPATPQTLDWSPDPNFPGIQKYKSANINLADRLKLEEYKLNLLVELVSSESRVFRIKNRIIRTSIGDPRISEPVLVSENQLVVLGKEPGSTTLAIWDDADNVSVYKILVRRQELPSNLVAVDSHQDEGSQIPAAMNGTIVIEEIKKVRVVLLSVGETKFFKLPEDIIRSSVCDPRVATLSIPAENGIYLQGQSAGKTGVFIWDCKGNILGMDVVVTDEQNSKTLAPMRLQLAKKDLSKIDATKGWEIESWTGHQKEIVSPDTCLPRKLIQLPN
ncbi:MAG: pilus assembly protein N-terminal domain-containing protein [Candidatus Obscuribacterales bacterium]|nr:pilus assembly protein N-terminal domain-containing protein [Candidatus Obscuribacterales bacterium]